jgi:hypothetical protein
MTTVETHRTIIDGIMADWRSAKSPAGATLILYFHGVVIDRAERFLLERSR